MRVVSHELRALPDLEGGPDSLSGRDYSLMKHGDLPATHRLADRLADDIVAACPEALDPGLRVALPVAYMSVLPACGHLAARISQRLNEARRAVDENAHPTRVVRIAKSAVTTIDYAAASAAERREQMAALSFDVTEDIADELVILVDDVRITGLAERTAVAALEQARPAAIVPAYVAAIGPELADDPAVEKVLNHAAITDPAHMLPVMQRGEFALTIRYLKWALASPAVDDLLASIPEPIRAEMADGAAASGLWGRPEFARAQALLAPHTA